MRIVVFLFLLIFQIPFLNNVSAEDLNAEPDSAQNHYSNKENEPECKRAETKILFNGTQTTKKVIGITFKDNTTTLKWSDNTTMTGKAAESLISIALADDNEQDIDKVRIFVVGGIYSSLINVCGIEAEADYCIFDMKQRKVLEGKAGNATTTINIGDLNTGVYFLKSNRTIVKFTIGLNSNILSKN